MKTLTVRLPDEVVAQIEAESRRRKLTKSDVVRERLAAPQGAQDSQRFDAISDLVGSVESLPANLSGRLKHHLAASGYGRDRSR